MFGTKKHSIKKRTRYGALFLLVLCQKKMLANFSSNKLSFYFTSPPPFSLSLLQVSTLAGNDECCRCFQSYRDDSNFFLLWLVVLSLSGSILKQLPTSQEGTNHLGAHPPLVRLFIQNAIRLLFFSCLTWWFLSPFTSFAFFPARNVLFLVDIGARSSFSSRRRMSLYQKLNVAHNPNLFSRKRNAVGKRPASFSFFFVVVSSLPLSPRFLFSWSRYTWRWQERWTHSAHFSNSRTELSLSLRNLTVCRPLNFSRPPFLSTMNSLASGRCELVAVSLTFDVVVVGSNKKTARMGHWHQFAFSTIDSDF